MFRVLSEEESRKVTRWQAPELGSDTAVVANTRQQANPRHSSGDDVRPLLGSLALKPDLRKTPGAALQLQTINNTDVFADPSIADTHHALSSAQGNAVIESSEASAQMLQSTYDEGYARGFAEGNAALHQHSIQELRTIVAAIADTAARPDESGLEQAVLSLSMDIAKLVIRREVNIDDTVMLGIVSAGIEQLPGNQNEVRHVFLHPLDANVVRPHLTDNVDVRIIDDPSLLRGACRIESGASVVNAGVDNWLHNASVQLGLLTEQEADAGDATTPHTAAETATYADVT